MNGDQFCAYTDHGETFGQRLVCVSQIYLSTIRLDISVNLCDCLWSNIVHVFMFAFRTSNTVFVYSFFSITQNRAIDCHKISLKFNFQVFKLKVLVKIPQKLFVSYR